MWSVLLPRECQIFQEILDRNSGLWDCDWEGKARELYGRFYIDPVLTHEEHIWLAGMLEGELSVYDVERYEDERLLYPKMAFCLRFIKEQIIATCLKCKAEETKRLSCHNCGAKNQRYWYNLQHNDGTIVKRVCIKCVQDEARK
jgi:hypothetical protein